MTNRYYGLNNSNKTTETSETGLLYTCRHHSSQMIQLSCHFTKCSAPLSLHFSHVAHGAAISLRLSIHKSICQSLKPHIQNILRYILFPIDRFAVQFKQVFKKQLMGPRGIFSIYRKQFPWLRPAFLELLMEIGSNESQHMCAGLYGKHTFKQYILNWRLV